MAFDLQDLSDEKNWLTINIWIWPVIIELIRSFKIINDDRIELLSQAFCGGKVDKFEARQIGDMIEKKILPQMSDDSRIKIDLTITEEPDNSDWHRTKNWDENFSCTKEHLIVFMDFCHTCGGFEV